MYVDTIPNNYTAGAQVNAWIASMNYMRATIPTRYRGMVDMVDMALPYGSPTGAAGTALVDTNKFADNIHSSIVGTWGRLPRSARMLCARGSPMPRGFAA